MNMENNNVELAGTAATAPVYSHEVYGENFYTMVVESRRLSGVSDLIPCMVSERLFQERPIAPGDSVCISGQFRSYNKLVDGASRLDLQVFAREIEYGNEYTPHNSIALTGFICKPPNYRTTPFGREITDMLVAVNRSYNKSDYIPSIAWGRNARFARKLEIGEKVELSGRIQSREYEKVLETGEVLSRTAYEVSILCIKRKED